VVAFDLLKGELGMKTLAAGIVVALVAGCGPSTPECDSATVARCSGGVVSLWGCGSGVVVECAYGCTEEGATANPTCADALCKGPPPKMAGDPCQTAADCLPTPATWSSTEVTNTYLTCDTGTHTCVATDPPVVADWLKPCNPDVIERILGAQIDAGVSQGFDGVTADLGCAEGQCAIHREAGASCIANACTRVCTGDHECPRGSTCQGFTASAACGGSPGYCKPGGPDGIGFTCN
jgi:hypothetical protein